MAHGIIIDNDLKHEQHVNDEVDIEEHDLLQHPRVCAALQLASGRASSAESRVSVETEVLRDAGQTAPERDIKLECDAEHTLHTAPFQTVFIKQERYSPPSPVSPSAGADTVTVKEESITAEDESNERAEADCRIAIQTIFIKQERYSPPVSPSAGAHTVTVKEEPITAEDESNERAEADCSASEDEEEVLKSHKRSHTHTSKRFKCNQCDFESYNNERLQFQMSTHTGEMPFECNICKNKFSIIENLKYHMKTHKNERLIKCNLCKFRCSHKYILDTHMLIHTEKENFKCKLCSIICYSEKDFSSHLEDHIKNTPLPFKCNHCEYSCRSEGSLDAHVVKHIGGKKYHCLTCDHKSSLTGRFKHHLKQHTGDTPYIYYNYRGLNKGQVSARMKWHYEAKPYKCEMCEYTTFRRNDVKRHMTTHKTVL